jgi:hypothetical protein
MASGQTIRKRKDRKLVQEVDGSGSGATTEKVVRLSMCNSLHSELAGTGEKSGINVSKKYNCTSPRLRWGRATFGAGGFRKFAFSDIV